MPNHVAVLGASLGGLIAAAELRKHGCDVTVFEKGRSVGGLYSKTETPFGTQELGMHVLYASEQHFAHLCTIFGDEVFNVLRGPQVDMGASANFGKVYFDSHYPSLLGHPLCETVLSQIVGADRATDTAVNAEEEAMARFGATGGKQIINPILKKLWGMEPAELSRHAIHCFFDLRRMVVCDKAEADRLKDDPVLDQIIANPVQSTPKGQVFGGRIGLTFKTAYNDLSERVSRWADEVGITMKFGSDVSVSDGELCIGEKKVREAFDACIVAMPVHALVRAPEGAADKVELSICYFQTETRVDDEFPSYYILAHDPAFKTSRIVNYAAYNSEHRNAPSSVLAVESVHPLGMPPTEADIAKELVTIVPSARISASYRLPHSVGVYGPTLRNAHLLDEFQKSITHRFGEKPLYFTGMRTDTGIFFSHHTIGLAYDSALACLTRLA
ncbi:MAG TPA: NAD(P)-binding protein [Burkholderiaceae bacterium]|nr:NAD(P)-binding protein [Burkholderiaceae bacterium]